jgi:hypothetical protein
VECASRTLSSRPKVSVVESCFTIYNHPVPILLEILQLLEASCLRTNAASRQRRMYDGGGRKPDRILEGRLL